MLGYQIKWTWLHGGWPLTKVFGHQIKWILLETSLQYSERKLACGHILISGWETITESEEYWLKRNCG